jgi:hypothetical protein
MVSCAEVIAGLTVSLRPYGAASLILSLPRDYVC